MVFLLGSPFALLPDPSPATQTSAPAWTGMRASDVPAPREAPLRFGADAASLVRQNELGMAADYAVLWIGAWTLRWGWTDADRTLATIRAANVTPVVELYYWGDDLKPSCLERGCAGKSVAAWETLVAQLKLHLQAAFSGAPAVVVLETEFNKGSVATYKPLDGLLAVQAATLHGAPGVQVVLGFGDWNLPDWRTWSQAAAASDLLGVQAMFGSTRDAPAAARTLANRTLTAARTLAADFGKPVMIHDVAVSSYPGGDAAAEQAAAVHDLVACLPALKAAKVQAILYRSLGDAAVADAGNYYGPAERAFGLADSTGLKPAGQQWRAAMLAERATPAAATAQAAC